MTLDAKTAFFDSIADKWDGWEDLPTLATKLAAGLDELAVGDSERVLDVGCGTGNLTRALLDRLSGSGSVIAADISSRMIEAARRKIEDPRVSWLTTDAGHLPIADAECDRVFCCAVWPHFDDREGVATELARVLRPGGSLHVWHLIAREKVNEIHAGASEAVSADVLPPANETATLLTAARFRVVTATESNGRYLVTAVKPERWSPS